MMLKIILMVTFMLLVPAAILTSLPHSQGSAGVVSVMVAAAGGCWAAIQLYQVIISMMTMIVLMSIESVILIISIISMMSMSKNVKNLENTPTESYQIFAVKLGDFGDP